VVGPPKPHGLLTGVSVHCLSYSGFKAIWIVPQVLLAANLTISPNDLRIFDLKDRSAT